MEADRLVWIFGSARTGSTWLASMMADPHGYSLWDEPLVGQMLGGFEVLPRQRSREEFIFAEQYEANWLASIRRLVLDAAEARYPDARCVIVKEPNGSTGAPLLMRALPESAMVLLVRDPRDVAASALDRHRPGGGAHLERAKVGLPENLAVTAPDRFIENQGRRYLRNVSAAKQAFDQHLGRKAQVHYEVLRYDAQPEMERITAELGIDFDRSSVERHDWENVTDKGPGKLRRKAQPGAWREDLTPAQASALERVTAPLATLYAPETIRASRPPAAPRG